MPLPRCATAAPWPGPRAEIRTADRCSSSTAAPTPDGRPQRVRRSGRLGVRLVAANRPGYGASTARPRRTGASPTTWSSWPTRSGLDPFGLLGMSVGGTFALACAAYHPDRVRGRARGDARRGGPDGPALHPRRPRPRRPCLVRRPRVGSLEGPSDGATGLPRLPGAVDPTTPTTRPLAERWAESPAGGPCCSRPDAADLAADAREALLVPTATCRRGPGLPPLAVRRRGRRVPGHPLVRRAGREAPPRNGRGWPTTCRTRPCSRLPGLGHLESLLRSWPDVLRQRLSRVTARPGRRSSSTLNAALVEHRHAELLGLLGLGAGVVADHDVVGLLRHRAGGLAAARQDRLLGRVAARSRPASR